MKSTSKKQCNRALLYTVAFCAAWMSGTTLANPFNDSTTNSVLTDTDYNETLYVGIQNPDNTLLIDSNATVSATDVILGQLSSSANNSISVNGGARLIAGNVNTNGLATGGVVVGSADGNPAVSINNSSTLNTEYLYVGFGTNDSGKIELTGDGSELNVAQNAYVGYAGSANTIEVGNGSTLNVGNMLTVSSAVGSNNTVNVASGGTLFVNSTNHIDVVNQDADNGIVVKNGGTLQIGSDVHTGAIEDQGIDLQANSNLELGGSLTLDQNEIDSRLNIILNDALSTNNASWVSGSLTAIGSTTSDNSLTFTNGATGLALNILQVGQGTSALRNEVNVGGSNSLLNTASDVFIGAQGDNNQLNIADDGQVNIAGNLYLGNNASATGNEANVYSNGILSVTGDIIVGDQGAKNTFAINSGDLDAGSDLILGKSSANNRFNQTGGTASVSGNLIIGSTDDAGGKTGRVDDDIVETTGNLAIIGEDASLNIGQNLTVGREGGGSIMTIRDGGAVNVSGNTIIGETVGDNYIYLQRDSNTVFNVTGDLIVGKTKEGSNRFAAYGGTANVEGDLLLGATTNQHTVKNFIHLETSNAVLNVANTTYIGASNSVNTLDIVNGASLNTKDLFVGAYEGLSDNVVTVTGEGSLLQVMNTLGVGSSTGSNNTVIVETGGTLDIDQNGIDLSGSENTLRIADGGTLKSGDWDYTLLTGSETNILFEGGSTLHLLGMLSGTNEVNGSMNIVLDGTNSSWNTATNGFYVGNQSSTNSLTVTNGAIASTATNFYIGFGSDNNIVTVGGNGSWLDVGGTLYIGNDTNSAAYYNTLAVLAGGAVDVSGDLVNGQAGTLRITSDSQVRVAGNYQQTFNAQYNEGSRLELGVSTNQTAPNLLVDGNANFESGSTLSIFNDGIGDDATNLVQNVVVADTLTIDEETASTGLLLEGLNIESNLLLGFNITVSNANTIVLDNFIVRSLGEAAGLEGQLLDVADQIDLLAKGGDTNAQEMLNILDKYPETAGQIMDNYYGEKMSSSPAHNVINLGVQTVAEQLTKRADNTRVRMGRASAGLNAPAGASGPHMDEQELQGWFTGFKTWADRSADSGFDGYDGSINGFLLGADLSVAEGILFGVAGGSASSSMDKDNGASSDTSTKLGTLYASAGTKDWFADASLIYGSSSVDSSLGAIFDTESDYDAENIAIYFGGGKEIIGNYLIVTPQASLLGNYYKQDSYEETSTTAVARKVDSFDAFYLQSAVGCNVGFYTAVGEMTIKPEVRAFWLHEFNAREEDLNYSLVGATGSYDLQLQAPESDIIKLGGGISAKMGQYLELRADLDLRVADSYSDHTLLGSIRYQF